MKLRLVLLLFLLTGCSVHNPDTNLESSNLSVLDAERYQVLNLNKFDNETTSCGMNKLLECLDVSENICHKIYRAAAVECFNTFYNQNGTDADICSPSNKEFIDGCMYKNVLKYGKGGMYVAIECMKST